MEQWLNEEWGGKYVKLKDQQSAGSERTAGDRMRAAASLLQGEYVSQTGVHAAFAYPLFTWKEGAVTETGGFCVTETEDEGAIRYLLSLKVIADQGLTVTDKFFTMDLTPPPPSGSPADGAPATAFTLKPAQTTVYGVVNLKGQPLAFTRQAQ